VGNFRLPVHELTGPDDAREQVEFWADQGVTSFKAFMHITRAELAAAVDAAHKRGLKVTGHLCSISFREATELGIDDIEHGFILDTGFIPTKKLDACPSGEERIAVFRNLNAESAVMQNLFRTLIQHHVAITSTLAGIEQYLSAEAPMQQRVLDVMSPQAQSGYLTQRLEYGRQPEILRKEMELEYAFVKAGGFLLAGPDPTGIGGTVAGFGDQRQVELLVKAGFTPLEAIHIATSNGAQFLGELDTIGTIAVGKRADLVVVGGDPATKISDIENVEIVFKDGIGYDSAKLINSVRGQVGLR
jgi:imidazolonepropionase-like amidohydrolase